MTAILGWDIGGVATKIATIETNEAGAGAVRPPVVSVPYEIRHDASGLPAALAQAVDRLGGVDPRCAKHAVTMTAELARAFRTKRDGVAFVLDALSQVTGGAAVHVYTADGRFITPEEAKAAPLLAAAANWRATASLIARTVPTCLLIDIGSTSTDIIPIVDGEVVARGYTDPERLQSSELVYTGAVRTPAEALVRHVPLPGGTARVAAEGFAITADAHLWLGRIAPDDCAPYPSESRPVDRAEAGDRLARVVCADREMLDDGAIDAIAGAIVEAQIAVIAEAAAEVRARHPVGVAVVAGLGDFIATEACARAGLAVVRLTDTLGAAARVAPAVAVATLLHEAQGSQTARLPVMHELQNHGRALRHC